MEIFHDGEKVSFKMYRSRTYFWKTSDYGLKDVEHYRIQVAWTKKNYENFKGSFCNENEINWDARN